jgi:hypothetical protein
VPGSSLVPCAELGMQERAWREIGAVAVHRWQSMRPYDVCNDVRYGMIHMHRTKCTSQESSGSLSSGHAMGGKAVLCWAYNQYWRCDRAGIININRACQADDSLCPRACSSSSIPNAKCLSCASSWIVSSAHGVGLLSEMRSDAFSQPSHQHTWACKNANER